MSPEEEIKQLQKIIDDMIDGMRDMLANGEILSDEIQTLIASELESTMDRITQLNEQIQTQTVRPERENIPDIESVIGSKMGGREISGGQPPIPIMGSLSVPQGSELLYILAGGDQNAFVNYLRTYPGDGFQELASNPNRLAQVLAHFERTIPFAPQRQDADGIQESQIGSSNVVGFKYDPQSQKLLVKFHGDNVEPVYQYDGVPPQIANLIAHGNASAKTNGKNKWGEWWENKNPSLGAAVNQYLKAGGYDYQRLN